jgi:hypothetical protein
VVALIGVHGYNETRFNLGELRASAEPLLARARQISDRARSEYEDLALATLAPSPLNEPYYRLDDKLNEAETIEQPADGLVTADGGHRSRLRIRERSKAGVRRCQRHYPARG